MDAEKILSFWFGAPAPDPPTLGMKFRRWYTTPPEISREISQRFGADVDRAVAGELDSWTETTDGRIALIILLDQFTRSVFRDDPRTYSGDQRAQRLAVEGLDRGLGPKVGVEKWLLMIMPLVHAEDLALQERACSEVRALIPHSNGWQRPFFEMGIEQTAKYRDIISRFGRFPHRNKLLGRTSTAEEESFIANWDEFQPPTNFKTIMENAETQRALQKQTWSVSAAGWERHDDWFDRNTASLSSWLCDAAALAPGKKVLDLATGVGQPALTAAARVRPGGTVLATDVAPQMVEATRRKAERSGFDNVEAREMDAEQIDAPDATFDAVTCRFGLMFCPDMVRASREVHRVLRPGGRFAVAVWDVPGKNPYFTTLSAIGKYVPMPPPAPNLPGPFRLAPPGALEGVLRDGGFTEIQVEPRTFELCFDSFEDYWRIQSVLAPPLKAATVTLTGGEIEGLKGALREALAPFTEASGLIRLPAVALCAIAVR
jgi:uncharacterized protein (DUF924 family)/SAM-dependent methyltransferase